MVVFFNFVGVGIVPLSKKLAINAFLFSLYYHDILLYILLFLAPLQESLNTNKQKLYHYLNFGNVHDILQVVWIFWQLQSLVDLLQQLVILALRWGHQQNQDQTYVQSVVWSFKSFLWYLALHISKGDFKMNRIRTLKSLISMEFFLFFLRKNFPTTCLIRTTFIHFWWKIPSTRLLEPARLFILG